MCQSVAKLLFSLCQECPDLIQNLRYKNDGNQTARSWKLTFHLITIAEIFDHIFAFIYTSDNSISLNVLHVVLPNGLSYQDYTVIHTKSFKGQS